MNIRNSAAAILAASSTIAMAANDVPASQPLARYDKMIARSPFAPATPAEPVAAATPGFATQLYVAGIAKISGGDLVTIRTKDQQRSFSIASGEQGPDGIMVVGVQWADQVGRSKVTVRRGTETAVIEFDQATLQKAIAPIAAPGGSGPRPIALPGNPFSNHGGGSSGQASPQPPSFPQGGRGFHGSDRGGSSGDSSDSSQRRIRIIPSKPGQ
jgi:hypothetical protein